MRHFFRMCRAAGWLVFLAASSFFPDQVLASETLRPALIPERRMDAWWIERHEQIVARVHAETFDLVFIGDSITQGWEGAGRRVWERSYKPRRTLNLGFNGDRTEHVLWRLQHGELAGQTPKLVVVMIGTNNTGTREDPAEDTVAGIHAIVALLRERIPTTRILLLSVFPRGDLPEDSLRRLNTEVNRRLPTLADEDTIVSLDLARHFVDGNGRLLRRLMPDGLHPNEEGYQAWAEAMEATLQKLLSRRGCAAFCSFSMAAAASPSPDYS